MTADTIDLLNARLDRMDGRLERIEGILMAGDEEDYSPKHLWDRMEYFCAKVEENDRRLRRLEVWQGSVLAIASFVMVVVVPVVTLLAPALRRLLGLPG